MRNHRRQKPKLVGSWRTLHGAVWMIGLAILAWQDWWWPGIMVLVGISMLIEGVLMQLVPQAFEDEVEQPQIPPSPLLPLAPFTSTAVVLEHPYERLPGTCPQCGGPIRGHEVKWIGVQAAACPYCGTNLPMAKG